MALAIIDCQRVGCVVVVVVLVVVVLLVGVAVSVCIVVRCADVAQRNRLRHGKRTQRRRRRSHVDELIEMAIPRTGHTDRNAIRWHSAGNIVVTVATCIVPVAGQQLLQQPFGAQRIATHRFAFVDLRQRRRGPTAVRVDVVASDRRRQTRRPATARRRRSTVTGSVSEAGGFFRIVVVGVVVAHVDDQLRQTRTR